MYSWVLGRKYCRIFRIRKVRRSQSHWAAGSEFSKSCFNTSESSNFFSHLIFCFQVVFCILFWFCSFCNFQIVVQMESSQKLYNPHHRARLAEGLEAILPTNKNVVKQPIPDQGAEHRKQLFLTHPLRQQVRTKKNCTTKIKSTWTF